jgi:hypothetical protein
MILEVDRNGLEWGHVSESDNVVAETQRSRESVGSVIHSYYHGFLKGTY